MIYQLHSADARQETMITEIIGYGLSLFCCFFATMVTPAVIPALTVADFP